MIPEIGLTGGALMEFDDTVGALNKTLKDLGVADNTIVVLVSDNAAMKFAWPDGGTSPFMNQVVRVTVAKGRVRSRSWQRPVGGRVESRSCVVAFSRNESLRAKCNGWNVRHSTTASRENRPTNNGDLMKAKAHRTSLSSMRYSCHER